MFTILAMVITSPYLHVNVCMYVSVCVCIRQNLSNCTVFLSHSDGQRLNFFQSKMGETWHMTDV